MVIILGLVILIAALVAGIAGVLGNGGSAHAVSHFSVLGYHQTGSAGVLFLTGIIVGAAGLLGLSLVLAGARRTARRGQDARRGLQQSRRETAAASQERDDLIVQRDTARAYTASNLAGDGTVPQRVQVKPADDRWGRFRGRKRASAPVQATATPDSPAPDVAASPAGAGPEVPAAAGGPADGSDAGPDAAAPVLDSPAAEPAPAQ
jgi:uncharacterized protein (DUF3084 family)